jgi:ABC-type sugar transport system ATPase subunit
VALGKWLGIEPSILLVEEPTRGVDVGARAEIYRHLRTLANQGLAIVFASFDNQEILGLSDTIATFFRGRLVRVAPADSVKPEALLRDVTHPETPSVGEAA